MISIMNSLYFKEMSTKNLFFESFDQEEGEGDRRRADRGSRESAVVVLSGLPSKHFAGLESLQDIRPQSTISRQSNTRDNDDWENT